MLTYYLSNNFATYYGRRHTRSRHGQLPCIKKIFHFAAFTAGFKYGSLHQGICQSISIALKCIVIAYKVAVRKRFLKYNAVPHILPNVLSSRLMIMSK